jgi:MraZ protein
VAAGLFRYRRGGPVYNVQGCFHCSLDSKGRLTLPARLKEAVKAHEQGSLVLAFFDDSLQGYTTEYWRKLEAKVSRRSLFSRKARSFVIGFLANAHEVSVDKLGRVLIPPPLRSKGGLEREVVVLSYLGQIEIWDRDRFENRQVAETADMDVDDFVDDLAVPLDDEGV